MKTYKRFPAWGIPLPLQNVKGEITGKRARIIILCVHFVTCMILYSNDIPITPILETLLGQVLYSVARFAFPINSFACKLISKLTHSMKHSPTSEVDSSSHDQEKPRLLWNPEVHYWEPAFGPVLMQLNPIILISILILFHICAKLPFQVVFLRLPTKN